MSIYKYAYTATDMKQEAHKIADQKSVKGKVANKVIINNQHNQGSDYC